MQAFLNRCAEIEDTLAGIYRELASTVSAEQELKAIWLAMADDEGEHGREIRMAKRMVKEDILVGEQISDAEVRSLLFRARSLLDKVRRSPLSVKEALRLSLHMEEDFRRVHVLFAVRFGDTGIRRVFERLGQSDREHVARLTEYCRTRVAADSAGKTTSPQA
jgi:rubrerythrin